MAELTIRPEEIRDALDKFVSSYTLYFHSRGGRHGRHIR
jgi:hypothetical protein